MGESYMEREPATVNTHKDGIKIYIEKPYREMPALSDENLHLKEDPELLQLALAKAIDLASKNLWEWVGNVARAFPQIAANSDLLELAKIRIKEISQFRSITGEEVSSIKAILGAFPKETQNRIKAELQERTAA